MENGDLTSEGAIKPNLMGGQVGDGTKTVSNTSSSRSGIVTARGTGDGLVIRLDGRVDTESLRAALYDFTLSRKSFLSGNKVSFEWIEEEPSTEVFESLKTMLFDEFEVAVTASNLQRKNKIERITDSNESSLGLFGGIEGIETSSNSITPDIDVFGEPHPPLQPSWDDPDARVVYATLRSGQRIETEHTLIVVGDVNSGAELIAGGDIIVLGTLRGVAHAGAYDETGGGRFIFGLSLQPTQLRIGIVISRGTKESGKVPEIARVDDNMIVVEPYHAKTALAKAALGGMRRF